MSTPRSHVRAWRITVRFATGLPLYARAFHRAIIDADTEQAALESLGSCPRYRRAAERERRALGLRPGADLPVQGSIERAPDVEQAAAELAAEALERAARDSAVRSLHALPDLPDEIASVWPTPGRQCRACLCVVESSLPLCPACLQPLEPAP